MTLTDFLLARIAEDEKRWTNPAFVRLSGPWLSDLVLKMRAECEAKRRIVEDFTTLHADYQATHSVSIEHRRLQVAISMGHLAAIYADHPDYDESWRP